jgi:hypothetical protein
MIRMPMTPTWSPQKYLPPKFPRGHFYRLGDKNSGEIFFDIFGNRTYVAGSGGYCEDITRYCSQYPREESQEWFYWWKMVGWKPRDGTQVRGDSNTHASETPRSRVHVEAGISRLENNFGV